MLFNSYIYIILFLPAVLLGYFLLNRFASQRSGQAWLVAGSLFFYSYWNLWYLPLILFSILFNFWLGERIMPTLGIERGGRWRKELLVFGITINLGLLGFFKYYDFFLENINTALGSDLTLLHLALPIGISFFTFQQIAYLVDSFKGLSTERNFFSYALFVTFFPQLIAGPIVHHQEMIPQFSKERAGRVNYDNIAQGLFIFFIGLFKKVVIADTFAQWANWGFDTATHLSLFEGWVTTLSYALQLYFDFSGYTDMAIGAALLFNIRIVQNFNSPYRATNIQDFWRRWHITLSRFLRAYLYIPLGGNRRGEMRLHVNLLTVFILGGLWHGANWTFVVWGALHGLGNSIYRMWSRWGVAMPQALAWFITFNFVMIAWVFFRAKSFADAGKVLGAMFNISDLWATSSVILRPQVGVWLAVFLVVVLFYKNSNEMALRFRPSVVSLAFIFILFFVSFYNLNNFSEFIYFAF